MLFYLLECSTVNSYILYQEACREVGTKCCYIDANFLDKGKQPQAFSEI